MEEAFDPQKIEEDVKSGKTVITWAVWQFPDDLKLTELQQTGDIAKFIRDMNENDPYEMRAQPDIGGIHQYIVMARDNSLPFMEDGVLEKHKDDLAVSGMLREQLEIYRREFPWTAEYIDKALQKADSDDCT